MSPDLRTKLDEIVDEEWKRDGTFNMTMKRIAERAFRHGVEQTGRVVEKNHWGAYITGALYGATCNVQPAPAEEKLPGCVCGTTATVHRTDGPCFMDRRKGERRKEMPIYVVGARGDQYVPLYTRAYDGACGGDYVRIDRRSDKERRK